MYSGRSPSRDVAVEISLDRGGAANRKIEQVSGCGMMHYSSESVSLQVRETSVAGCVVSNFVNSDGETRGMDWETVEGTASLHKKMQIQGSVRIQGTQLGKKYRIEDIHGFQR